jgi:hypothetical protein
MPRTDPVTKQPSIGLAEMETGLQSILRLLTRRCGWSRLQTTHLHEVAISGLIGRHFSSRNTIGKTQYLHAMNLKLIPQLVAQVLVHS